MYTYIYYCSLCCWIDHFAIILDTGFKVCVCEINYNLNWCCKSMEAINEIKHCKKTFEKEDRCVWLMCFVIK